MADTTKGIASLLPDGRKRVRMALSDGHMDVCLAPDASPRTIAAMRSVGEAALAHLRKETVGNFRIIIEATGGHGDARDIDHDGTLDYESLPENSVDRVAYEAVQSLKKRGCTVQEATLTHWPGTDSQVVDDVLHSKRLGSFGF